MKGLWYLFCHGGWYLLVCCHALFLSHWFRERGGGGELAAKKAKKNGTTGTGRHKARTEGAGLKHQSKGGRNRCDGDGDGDGDGNGDGDGDGGDDSV
jgi:hypothetical protein